MRRVHKDIEEVSLIPPPKRAEPGKAIKKKYMCEICSHRVVTPSKLKKHMKVHENGGKVRAFMQDPKRRHLCPICSHKTISPSKLKRHMRVHRKEGLAIDMSEDEETKKELAETDGRRNPNRVHVCKVCSLEFNSFLHLKAHSKVHILNFMKTADLDNDEERENFVCKFCQRDFGEDDVQEFIEHLKSHNINLKLNKVESLQCCECKQNFKSEHKLEIHQIGHTDLIKECKIQRNDNHDFICIVCSFKIPDYDELMNHMKNHKCDVEDKEILCQLCLIKLIGFKSIIGHAQVHEENVTHKCCRCDLKFGYGQVFIDHMLLHQDMKPFSCEF